MELAEYTTMFEAEDRHWWYVGLRKLLLLAWARHVRAERPLVLDVGCGTGANLAALRHLARPVGIDFEHEAIRACHSRSLSCTAAASALALPFAAASFDVVLSCDVLCHGSIPDEKVALEEMRRVLRPDGLLLINLPAYQWLLSAHDRAYGQDRRYTRGGLTELLQTTGFEPVAATYWNTLLFPAAAGVRVWRKFSDPGRSDLAAGSAQSAGTAFGAMLGVERTLIRRFSLPFGLSVFAIGRKVR